MQFNAKLALAACASGQVLAQYASGFMNINGTVFQSEDIIMRDVCILGGGSTGTYSAVRLSQDLGKSVVVVEQNDRLGGHTQTYIDPVTNHPVEIGVAAWHNYSTVTNFFTRFNISLSTYPTTDPFENVYFNLRTGQVATEYSSSPVSELLPAIYEWINFQSQVRYLPYGMNITYPVSEQALQPFGDTIQQLNLSAFVPLIWRFAHNLGDMINAPTIYVAQNYGLPQLANDYVFAADHENSEIYQRAAALLGENVLFNSTASEVIRRDGGPQTVIVQTPNGQKLIVAKKILVTFPPTLSNLASFTLTDDEEVLFPELQGVTYYTGLIRNGAPDGVTVNNVDTSAPFNIPLPPFVTAFQYTGVPGLHLFYHVSNSSETQEEAEAFVLAAAAPFVTAGIEPATIEIIASHTPPTMSVSPDAISNGFYASLNSLQGHRSTYWTGLTWAPADSRLLWRFTDESILPQIVADLA